MFTVQEVEASASLLHMNPEMKMDEQGSIDPKPREGRTHFLNLGRSKEELRHNVREEPEENPSKNWDTQLQEFLKTLQDPQERRQVPQCLEPNLWSGPKLCWRSSQGGMDTSKWSKEMWISQIEAHLLETIQENWDILLDVAHGGKEKVGEPAEEVIGTEVRGHRFWTLSYSEAKGPRDFCRQLQELCNEWLKPEKHTKEQILDLVTLEQFLSALPLNIQNWLRRNGPKTCLHAVSLAEEFLSTREEIQTWEEQATEISEDDIGEAPKSDQLPSEPTEDEDFEMIEPGSDGSSVEDTEFRLFPAKKRNKEQIFAGTGCLNESSAPELKNSENRQPLEMFLKAATKTDLLAFKENDGNHDTAPKRNGSDVGKRVGQLVYPQSVSPGLRDPAVQEEKTNNNGSGSGERVNQRLKSAETPHAEQKVFRCWHCGQSFQTTLHLVTHERTHVGEKLYKCSRCGESERTHIGQTPHHCSHCGNTLSCPTHEKTSTQEKSYVCAKCGKNCSQESDLLKHQRTHTGEKPYECSACGNNFRKESSIKVHQKIHTGEKPCKCLSSCSHSGKSFGQKSEEHEKTHPPEDLLACSACGKTFELRSELTAHMRAHKEKPLECSACEKTFTNSLQLVAHQKVHKGEEPHKCSHCEKSFGHRQSLIAHERIHGAKPHKCSECGKNFQNSQNLKFHEKTHTGEKSYHCSHCDKSFRWSSHFQLHNRIHTGEKPFWCSDCGRTFDRKANLQRHMRTHTGQEPFVCSDCGESFTSSSVLLQHQEVHLGEDVAKCLECGKDFRQRRDQAEKVSKCPQCTQGPSLSSDPEGAPLPLKEKMFECSLCRKAFKNSSQLMTHQSVHTEVRPRQECLECGRNIVRRPNFIGPLENLSGQTPHKCSECEKLSN